MLGRTSWCKLGGAEQAGVGEVKHGWQAVHSNINFKEKGEHLLHASLTSGVYTYSTLRGGRGGSKPGGQLACAAGLEGGSGCSWANRWQGLEPRAPT